MQYPKSCQTHPQFHTEKIPLYNIDFRLHFKHFELNSPPQEQKVNYVSGTVLEIQLEWDAVSDSMH